LTVQYGKETYYVTLKNVGTGKITFGDISNIIYQAYPADYPPDSPLVVETMGTIYQHSDQALGYDVEMVVGLVGYYSGGKLVQWNGVAVSVGVQQDMEVTKVITPRGYITCNPGERRIIVFSPVWSLYAKSGTMSVEL